MDKPIQIVQITDTHFFATPETRLLGLNTHDSFIAVMEAIKTQIKHSDLWMHTGDISQDYTDKSYQRLAKLLDAVQVPIYWTAGNHDDLATLSKNFVGKHIRPDKSIIINNWHIILLNSQIPHAVPGTLSKTELDFLTECLKKYPQHHTLISFHHHPLLVKSAWLDKLNLMNAEDLFAIIDQFPQVRCVLYGHIHQEFTGSRNNIPYLATPATSVQFKPHQEKFALDLVYPGFRTLTLKADGSVDSKVHRATQFSDYRNVDEHAKGY